MLLAGCGETPPAARDGAAPDLILAGARVWTVDPLLPEAQAIAVRGDRIQAVGSETEIRGLADPGHTRVLELPGRLVLPGFIDNHVHFTRAGRLLLGVNLLDVNEPEAFRARVAEAASRLPPGAWLVGGDWGAYADWALGSAGEAGDERPFEPDRALLDDVTGDHPALISRFDGELHLANALALEAAGIDRSTPDPEGGEIVRDAVGVPNGLLRGRAVERVRAVLPETPHAVRRAEALAALERARSRGVTGFHDNVADFEQLELLRELHRDGALTARVWARMRLSEWPRVAEYIEQHDLPVVAGGWGDDWIRLGGLKAWVDGIMGNSTALFFEPYAHRPDENGSLRDVMFPEGNLQRLIAGADAAGFTVTVHAIGDQANRILLDTYERVLASNPARERRHRVVHAQIVHPDDMPRFGELGLVAEVQPYHCIDDMRWMEERIGARAARAYRFRSLGEAAARLSFGSDWPGTNASWYPIDPLLGIYAATTRQTLEGEPTAGWYPDERIGVAEAIEAYTLSNAWATFEEASRGSITAGKLADLVVVDRDVLASPPEDLKRARVLYTIVGGRVVYESAESLGLSSRSGAAPAPR
jgi:hypothetical protein